MTLNLPTKNHPANIGNLNLNGVTAREFRN